MAEVAFKGVKRLLSPEDWIARQIGNLEAVGRTNYVVGISAPKKNPIEAGIAAEPRYADAMRKVIAEKRRAEALKFVTMEDWFKYASELGAERLVPGVTVRRAKVERFVTGWHPLLLAHVQELDKMPVTTLEERINKMVNNVRGLVALKGKWRRK